MGLKIGWSEGSITPEENPKISALTPSEILSLNSHTHAAPSAVVRNKKTKAKIVITISLIHLPRVSDG